MNEMKKERKTRRSKFERGNEKKFSNANRIILIKNPIVSQNVCFLLSLVQLFVVIVLNVLDTT